MIEVSNLIFEYPGRRVLHGLNFSLPSNSVTALVGPNGAGKTTLLRCLVALEQPFSGSMMIAGYDVVQEPRKVHTRVGFLYDFYGLYNELSVSQSLYYRVAAQGVAENMHAQRVEMAIERLGLQEMAQRKAGELSRGWRQKLSIALAIVHDPGIILLDEPASGLDPEARAELSGLFRNLQSEGKTLLVSSHILGELEDYSSHLLMIREGRVSSVTQVGKGAQEEQALVTMRLEVVEELTDSQWRELLADIGVNVITTGERHVFFTLSAAASARHKVLKELLGKGVNVCSFEQSHQRLQDAYKDKLENWQ